MRALEIDLVLRPQPADYFKAFVRLAAARLGVEVQRLPLRPERAADAKRRQQPPIREKVDGCALFGNQNGVAQGQRQHVDAEFETPRAPGERRHDAHAFEDGFAADDAVGLPQRINAPRLAQIDPAPEAGGAGKGELHESHADGDIPRHRFLPKCFRSLARLHVQGERLFNSNLLRGNDDLWERTDLQLEVTIFRHTAHTAWQGVWWRGWARTASRRGLRRRRCGRPRWS